MAQNDRRSLLKAACGWLNHAENARKTAEQLTDREAKEVMAQLGQMYLRRAQTALAQAAGREFSLVTQLGMQQRRHGVAASGGGAEVQRRVDGKRGRRTD